MNQPDDPADHEFDEEPPRPRRKGVSLSKISDTKFSASPQDTQNKE